MSGTAGLDENTVEPDDDCRVQLGQLRGCFEKNEPALLVADCKSLYDATHKERAAPSSTDKRHATELPIVKSRAVEGEADLTWIVARYQIADCLTKHASRKAEEALQQVINKAQWWTTEEETMLETRRTERERPRKLRQTATEGAEATLFLGRKRILEFLLRPTCAQGNSQLCD